MVASTHTPTQHSLHSTVSLPSHFASCTPLCACLSTPPPQVCPVCHLLLWSGLGCLARRCSHRHSAGAKNQRGSQCLTQPPIHVHTTLSVPPANLPLPSLLWPPPPAAPPPPPVQVCPMCHLLLRPGLGCLPGRRSHRRLTGFTKRRGSESIRFRGLTRPRRFCQSGPRTGGPVSRSIPSNRGFGSQGRRGGV